MYTEQEIRDYVRENWRFFGPDGLGWKRASSAIKAYSADSDAWADDLYSVDDLRNVEERPKRERERELERTKYTRDYERFRGPIHEKKSPLNTPAGALTADNGPLHSVDELRNVEKQSREPERNNSSRDYQRRRGHVRG